MKKRIRVLLMFSGRQQHKLMQWKQKYLAPKKMKAHWKLNHL
ncbi:TPA: exonuclease VIII [Escherichia albertii]|nr:exonuclease VIII [Escherichia albertii]HAH3044897.1 exonuclease VIII [Escherichia albertii]HAH3053817.1 exonuclease VIII [Escherichia albertii]